jgi:hypothetical protein
MTKFSKKFCAKSPFKNKPDTLDITLADNIYAKDKIDSTLIKQGYDPSSRKTYGKTGIGGKIPKKKVSKIDQNIYATSEHGQMVPVPTSGYMGGQF